MAIKRAILTTENGCDYLKTYEEGINGVAGGLADVSQGWIDRLEISTKGDDKLDFDQKHEARYLNGSMFTTHVCNSSMSATVDVYNKVTYQRSGRSASGGVERSGES